MQPTPPTQSKNKLIALVVAIIVIAGVVVVADRLKNKNSDMAAPTTSQAAAATTSATSSSSTGTVAASNYKDGTYSASGDYYVPHGNEDIKVTLTLQGGVVTASSIVNSEGDHDSIRYQEDFASAYKSYVVGKKLSDIKLGNVAGASDTVEGFNEALSKIADQAKA